jgi:hypothetical protein
VYDPLAGTACIGVKVSKCVAPEIEADLIEVGSVEACNKPSQRIEYAFFVGVIAPEGPLVGEPFHYRSVQCR